MHQLKLTKFEQKNNNNIKKTEWLLRSRAISYPEPSFLGTTALGTRLEW